MFEIFEWVLLETKYGPENEAFTLAHEMGHLAKEFLPMRMVGRSQLELFDGACSAEFLHADPPGNVGAVPSSKETRLQRAAWLREVVANKCAAELMAPYSAVTQMLRGVRGGAVELLMRRFGLPRRAAELRVGELGLQESATEPTLF